MLEFNRVQRIVFSFFCLLLVIFLLFAYITDGFKDGNPYCWFGHDYADDTGICVKCGEVKAAGEEDKNAADNVAISTLETSEIRLRTRKISPARFAEEGISPLAESAIQVTATISPANATNTAVDWTVSFVNSASAWADDKNVEDYVSVEAMGDGSLTANITCFAAFGEQISVTVTSRSNSSAKASVLVDYYKRAEFIDGTNAGFLYLSTEDIPVFQLPEIKYWNSTVLFDSDVIFERHESSFTFATGTVDQTYSIHSIKLTTDYSSSYSFPYVVGEFNSSCHTDYEVDTLGCVLDHLYGLDVLGTGIENVGEEGVISTLNDLFESGFGSITVQYTFVGDSSGDVFNATFFFQFSLRDLFVNVQSLSVNPGNVTF